jgi:acylphosphatase
MTIKKKILIRGAVVHDIGYRPFLLGIAESLEIERFFADNLYIEKKQAVQVLVDSSYEKIKVFTEIISSKFPENSQVEKVEEEDYTGNVMKTESYYRYLTAMQLSKIATYGGQMLGKQDSGLDKMDSMLDKQDMTIEAIKDVSAKVDQNREEITAEIRSINNEIKFHFDERLSKLENEVSQIKANGILSKLIGNSENQQMHFH